MLEHYDSDYGSDTGTSDYLNGLFVGRRIVQAELEPNPTSGGPGGTLILDDDTRLTIVGNEGCACANGNYTVTRLGIFDNVITSAEVKEDKDEYGDPGNVHLFVYSEGIDGVEVVTAEGVDNGYYGTGFWIKVERPTTTGEIK